MSTAASNLVASDDLAKSAERVKLITFALAMVIFGYAYLLFAGVGKPASWLVDDKGQLNFTDFTALWSAGRLALEGRAAAVYDWQAHAETMSQVIGRAALQGPFPYPPTFLVVMAPVASLPYLFAMLTWSGLTLALYLTVCARIVGRWEGAIWLGAMIVTLANFMVGQNGFLTAALMGCGLLLLERRPLLAGVLLGVLSFKPHFGLLLPIALVAGGHWRAFGSAAATVVASALLALMLLGAEPWLAFLDSVGRFGAEVATERFMVTHKLQSVYGLLATLGVPKSLAMAAQAALAVVLAALTGLLWRSDAPYALKAAFVVAATVLALPYIFVYDLTMLAIAQAFLLRHWQIAGYGRREVAIVALVNFVLFAIALVRAPIGVLASVMMLAMVLGAARPWLSQVIAGIRNVEPARAVS